MANWSKFFTPANWWELFSPSKSMDLSKSPFGWIPWFGSWIWLSPVLWNVPSISEQVSVEWDTPKISIPRGSQQGQEQMMTPAPANQQMPEESPDMQLMNLQREESELSTTTTDLWQENKKNIRNIPISTQIKESIIPTAKAKLSTFEKEWFRDMITPTERWGFGLSPEDAKLMVAQYRKEQAEEQEVEEDEKFQEREDIEGFDVWVRLWKGISEFWEAIKISSNVDDNVAISIWKFLLNVPSSTARVAWGLLEMASNPSWTIKSMDKIWKSIIETWLNKVFMEEWEEVFTSEETKLISESVTEQLQLIADDPRIIKDMIVENPAEVLLSIQWWLLSASKIARNKKMINLADKIDKVADTLSLWNVLKSEWKVVRAWVSAISKGLQIVPPAFIWKTTGAWAAAIKEAFKSGWKESFAKALRGEITDNDLLIAARQGFETIKQQKSEVYGEDYKKLAQNKTKLWLEDIQSDLKQSLDEFKIKLEPTDKWIELNFDGSTVTQGSSKKQIQEMFDDILYWTDDTPDGLDTLKQRVQDRYLWWEWTWKADILSTKLSNKIKDKIVNEVPEYAQMTKSYENVMNELRDIEKTLKIWDDKNKASAITRLWQTFKDNIAFREEMVNKLEELSGVDLRPWLAWAALRDVMPKWLIWSIWPTSIWYWVWAWIFSPWLVVAMLGSSPRVIWEFARAIWVSRNILKKWLENAQKLFNLNQ